ncbi:hypothetical protein SH2C18_26560 [Clostridium sediminicola]|uniref:DUF58 domain-containing protein n=1 Tax=Clostridium sediminicola TaxID=3114879 RepID=UPI0031F1D36D
MKKYEINDEYSTVIVLGLSKFITISVLAISLINGAILMSILCICILALVYSTKLWAKLSLEKIETKVDLNTQRLFPKDIARLKIMVRNKKILPVWLKIEITTTSQISFIKETGLLSYSNLQHEWSLDYDKRGVYTIGPFNISAGDLLGFYSIKKEFRDTHEVIVYPKLISLRDYSPVSKEYFGNNKTREFVEDPVLITGTREYSFGRPAKHIHWKATAKTSKLQEKIFDPSAHIKVIIIIDVKDFKESEAYDEFETMLSTAASLAVKLSKRGISPGLMVNGFMTGDEVPYILPMEGKDYLQKFLEKLARLKMDVNDGYDKYIKHPDLHIKASYVYFGYSINENINNMRSSGKSIDIILSKTEKKSFTEKVYSIDELINFNIER